MNTNGTPTGKLKKSSGRHKKTFSTGDIAKICDVAPRTVSGWIDGGQLKGYCIPGSKNRRVTRENLILFIRETGMSLAEFETDERRVLFIGCDKPTCDAIAERLTETDWQFRGAADGFAAGMLVTEWEPSIVVIDFVLGRSVCLDMARQLMAHDPARRIVGLVGEEDTELSRTIRDHGFDGAFQSPIDYATVATTIRTLSEGE